MIDFRKKRSASWPLCILGRDVEVAEEYLGVIIRKAGSVIWCKQDTSEVVVERIHHLFLLRVAAKGVQPIHHISVHEYDLRSLDPPEITEILKVFRALFNGSVAFPRQLRGLSVLCVLKHSVTCFLHAASFSRV